MPRDSFGDDSSGAHYSLSGTVKETFPAAAGRAAPSGSRDLKGPPGAYRFKHYFVFKDLRVPQRNPSETIMA